MLDLHEGQPSQIQSRKKSYAMMMTRRLFFAVLAGAPMIWPKASGLGVWYGNFGQGMYSVHDRYAMTRAVTRSVPSSVECDELRMILLEVRDAANEITSALRRLPPFKSASSLLA